MLSRFKLGTFTLISVVVALWIISIAAVMQLLGKLPQNTVSQPSGQSTKVVQEESAVIDVVDRASPSVVTVSVETPKRRVLDFSPFGGQGLRIEGGQQQDIGTGFVVGANGLIVTNKHVVSNSSLKYKVITKDNREYEAKQISRDPSNDLAIIKIDAGDLKPLDLGDSSNLKVGQFVIAIGTALGQFRDTVTTGVVSGLGRGISAGDPFQGAAEQLDNVIQTDAAINPGNSGGPLLNSSGQAIGINVAVAQGAQNIGFALPINTVKSALSQFGANGKFPSKAFLGVQYQMVSAQAAILNNVPPGAYVVEVVSGSAADRAGVKVDDIIVELDGQKLTEDNNLASVINNKKAGDEIKIRLYRDGKTIDLSATLKEAPGE